ncbi:guanosine-5'-triphosphate,3'-diphosphate pyrophosphatase, partial [Photobacterium damselae subsp. damselae]
ILCHRRDQRCQADVQINATDNKLTLTLTKGWLTQNPLTEAELQQEATRQTDMGWPLTIETVENQ